MTTDTMVEAWKWWTITDLQPNPLLLGRQAQEAGMKPTDYVVEQLRTGELRFAAEDQTPENFPRILASWRTNLLGSSGQGH